MPTAGAAGWTIAETLTLINIVASSLLACAVVAATYLGPVRAAKQADERRNAEARRSRKQQIFSTLMRTRRSPINPDHVGALNLIEIEFFDDENVLRPWKSYMTHLGTEHQRRGEEALVPGAPAELNKFRENAFHWRMRQERQSLLARVLHAIARNLDFKVEQLEIFEGGYTPQGWAEQEDEAAAVRKLFSDIYRFQRTLPVTVIPFPTQQSPLTDLAGRSPAQSSEAAPAMAPTTTAAEMPTPPPIVPG